MRTGDGIPSVGPDLLLPKALLEVTRKGMAMTAIVDQNAKVLGIFTDGDLRRLIELGKDFSRTPVHEVMNATPRTISPEQLAVEAVDLMESFRINQVLVTDSDGTLVGALHIHDLTRAKVI
jgi:arabinose-5-phosphate isomerase